jgi:hypothetical protein
LVKLIEEDVFGEVWFRDQNLSSRYRDGFRIICTCRYRLRFPLLRRRCIACVLVLELAFHERRTLDRGDFLLDSLKAATTLGAFTLEKLDDDVRIVKMAKFSLLPHDLRNNWVQFSMIVRMAATSAKSSESSTLFRDDFREAVGEVAEDTSQIRLALV